MTLGSLAELANAVFSLFLSYALMSCVWRWLCGVELAAIAGWPKKFFQLLNPKLHYLFIQMNILRPLLW